MDVTAGAASAPSAGVQLRRATSWCLDGRRLLAVLLPLVLLASGCVSVGFNTGGAGGAGGPRRAGAAPARDPFDVCDVRDAPRPAADQAIVVRGCVASADGQPVQAEVVLGKEGSFLELLPLLVSLGTLAGPFCLPGCAPRGHQVLTAKTDADGQFAVRIPPGSEAAQPGSDFAAVTIPSTGVVVRAGFQVRSTGSRDIFLKPYLAWDPGLRLERDAGSVTPRFREIPGVDRYWLDADMAEGSLSVRDGRPFDLRLLPQIPTTQHLRVWGGTAQYYSPPVPAVPVPAPVSARARCFLVSPAGQRVRLGGMNPCPLTDRDRDTGVAIEDCGEQLACYEPGWVGEVDLGRVVAVNDVVVAGGRQVTVTVSRDGRNWTGLAVPDYDPESSAVSTLGAPTVLVRYLRVDPSDMQGLSEIELFS